MSVDERVIDVLIEHMHDLQLNIKLFGEHRRLSISTDLYNLENYGTWEIRASLSGEHLIQASYSDVVTFKQAFHIVCKRLAKESVGMRVFYQSLLSPGSELTMIPSLGDSANVFAIKSKETQ